VSDRVRVVCRPAVAAGFRLAGVRPNAVPDVSEGVRRVAGLLDDPTVGVLLVEEDVHAALPDTLRRAVARQPVPMIVPFPLPRWIEAPAPPEAFIAELLRRAIGYRVRLG
jgi:vacuolar-type H+-ATPase subunit F/Vma7